MSIHRYVSKIKKYFSEELLKTIIKIHYSRNVCKIPKEDIDKFLTKHTEKMVIEGHDEKYLHIRVRDNNNKMRLMKAYVEEFHWKNKNVNFGTGTNRLAVMVDNYVFKIGVDRAGCVDN